MLGVRGRPLLLEDRQRAEAGHRRLELLEPVALPDRPDDTDEGTDRRSGAELEMAYRTEGDVGGSRYLGLGHASGETDRAQPLAESHLELPGRVHVAILGLHIIRIYYLASLE